MINIQRNLFVENILSEAKINENFDFSKIPYRDNIVNFKNNNLTLIILDIDRIKNINFLKQDIKSIKNSQGYSVFIPLSKSKKKLII